MNELGTREGIAELRNYVGSTREGIEEGSGKLEGNNGTRGRKGNVLRNEEENEKSGEGTTEVWNKVKIEELNKERTEVVS